MNHKEFQTTKKDLKKKFDDNTEFGTEIDPLYPTKMNNRNKIETGGLATRHLVELGEEIAMHEHAKKQFSKKSTANNTATTKTSQNANFAPKDKTTTKK